ncbi:hypothetical protein R1sor_000515 [Riccia sorocarpa]|uniref:Formin-like protein n=1 Tax=Riccia sorocarpa TaxID=122646 RepID=A0ABD3GU53_9MARC
MVGYSSIKAVHRPFFPRPALMTTTFAALLFIYFLAVCTSQYRCFTEGNDPAYGNALNMEGGNANGFRRRQMLEKSFSSPSLGGSYLVDSENFPRQEAGYRNVPTSHRKAPTSAPAPSPAPTSFPGGTLTPSSGPEYSSAILAVAITVPVTAGLTALLALCCFLVYRQRSTSANCSSDGGSGRLKHKDDRPLLNSWLSKWSDSKKESAVFSVDASPSGGDGRKLEYLHSSSSHYALPYAEKNEMENAFFRPDKSSPVDNDSSRFGTFTVTNGPGSTHDIIFDGQTASPLRPVQLPSAMPSSSGVSPALAATTSPSERTPQVITQSTPGKGGPPPPPVPAKSGGPPPPPPLPPKSGGGPAAPLPIVTDSKPGGPPPTPPGLPPLRIPQPGGLKPPTSKPTSQPSTSSQEAEAGNVDVKLKPLHWEKVKPNAEHTTVWDNLLDGSFQLDSLSVESLFQYLPPAQAKNQGDKKTPLKEGPITILDPKKAHVMAIQLRGLGITADEVCEALLEGDEEDLTSDVLEAMVKMEPVGDELRKLREFSGDRSKLGPAERFLLAVLDVPSSFQRIKTMLFRSTFRDDLLQVEEAITVLEMGCKELKGSRAFSKLLEAVLKTGNRLNMGTNRGGAQAFKLDALLGLKDVKGTDSKTSLLHYVIQEIIRKEGERAARAVNEDSNTGSSPASPSSAASTPSGYTPTGALYPGQSFPRDAKQVELTSKHLGIQVVMGLSTELSNVKRAAGLDIDALLSSMNKLSSGLKACKASLRKYFQSTEDGFLALGGDDGQENIELSNDVFNDSMMSFVRRAESDINRVEQDLNAVLESVKGVSIYFYGEVKKNEPFLKVFQVVGDFLVVLDKVVKDVVETERHRDSKPALNFALLFQAEQEEPLLMNAVLRVIIRA